MAKKQRTLGEVLKAKRQEQELSLRALAEAVGIAPSNMLRFEDGTRRPTPELVKRLAKVLKTDAEELLGLANHSLPSFAPYLRAKYDLSDEAISELEAHFAAVTKQQPKRRGRS